jgi:hypothetical protein
MTESARDAKADPTQDPNLGSLSARYEAGDRGSTAVGHDTTGGWSYGKYQIATRTGTMKRFLAHVKEADPDLHAALDRAGGEKGATEHSAAFAKAWDKAARDGTLAPLEHGFIQETHFTPQQEKLAAAGLDLTKRDKALSDAVWSASVQHGPDSSVLTTALKNAVDAEKARDTATGHHRTDQQIIDRMDDKTLIDAIYDERGATKPTAKAGDKAGDKTVLKYFTRSSEAEQESVANRFRSERKAAHAELEGDRTAAETDARRPAEHRPHDTSPAAAAPEERRRAAAHYWESRSPRPPEPHADPAPAERRETARPPER